MLHTHETVCMDPALVLYPKIYIHCFFNLKKIILVNITVGYITFSTQMTKYIKAGGRYLKAIVHLEGMSPLILGFPFDDFQVSVISL